MAGGHSIDSAEPIYGLVALGLVHPSKLLRNSTAQAGDQLILAKALGISVLVRGASSKAGCRPKGYETLIAVTTELNRVGAELAGDRRRARGYRRHRASASPATRSNCAAARASPPRSTFAALPLSEQAKAVGPARA